MNKLQNPAIIKLIPATIIEFIDCSPKKLDKKYLILTAGQGINAKCRLPGLPKS